MKVISYNVNGLRAAIKKDLLVWLKAENPDVICFQETKSQPEQIDHELFAELGYEHHYWHSAVKKGYSGVATYSKIAADKCSVGMGMEKYDHEGRVISTTFGDTTILNCYFPSGSSGEERHAFKMDFLNDFGTWFKKQKKKLKDVIVLGDYNVVHGELDIHNPTRKDNPSGYRPEERAWMDEWFKKGMHDAFRVKYPETQAFSWWSYRANSRNNNKGWRIDYISVSDGIKDRLKECKQLNEAVHSDHCPVVCEFK